jgi:hypothetical protein
MNVDRMVIGFAGAVVLLGIALAHFVAPGWIWVSVFVGANLLQSSFTGFCPLERGLVRFRLFGCGVSPGQKSQA